MKIGYCKLGRSMPLDVNKFGIVGGDDEPPMLLRSLARRRPQDEFILIGRNSGENPEDVGLPSNVTQFWTPAARDELKSRAGNLSSPMTDDDKLRAIASFDALTLDVFRGLDAVIVWTGQHGTTSQPIPYVKPNARKNVAASWDDPELCTPQDWMVLYASYILRGLAAWRWPDGGREEIWLCPDPRNTVKCRDLMWPLRHPVISQFEITKRSKHERFRDTRSPAELGFDAREAYTHWVSSHGYTYDRLEICGIMPEHVDTAFGDNFEERDRFGLFINEARKSVKHNRLDALTEYVLPLEPNFVHGKWTPGSLEKVGRMIEPAPAEVYYDKLRSVRSTLTTPSSGSGWATTKPWQSFATGTVCFFHPEYDTQGHIIPTLDQVAANDGAMDDELAHLTRWLRVENPVQLQKRVEAVDGSPETWRWLASAQRRLYDAACAEERHLRTIDARLDA